ncbi:MAG: PmbA/TldA family metallopeptidase, partial [Promethearchaeota archaeon]
MTFQEDPKNPFEENYFDSISERISNKLDRRSEINHYEIYCSIVRSKSVGFEQGVIKKAQQKSSRGIGLRVIGNQGREGMTFTSDFSDLALEIIENQSIKMMKAATPNPFFKDLAHPSPNYTKISNIYDPTIQKLSIEQINEYLKPLMKLKERPHHPRSLSGSFSTALGATHIQNSNGISKWDKFSTASCSVEISLVENQVPSGGFDWQSVCQLKDLDVNHVAEYSYKVATRGLRRKSVQSGHYP